MRMSRRNWLRRADGQERTVKPTTAALNLLIAARNKIAEGGTWTRGMTIQTYSIIAGTTVGEAKHCLIGWLSELSGSGGNTYPNELLDPTATKPISLRHRYPVAVALLAETLNGNGIVQQAVDGAEQDYVNEAAVWRYNDNSGTGPKQVLDALDRTIRFAEHDLGVTS